jgi:mannitol-1-/sugar-/sorbitol-6-/2-deoxyglucose-6-phosphatase
MFTWFWLPWDSMATTPASGSTGLAAAVFDMDGLLIDSEPLWRQAEIRIFGTLGVALTAERCGETRGMVVNEVTRHWFEKYPWEGPTPDAVAAEIVDAVASLLAAGVTLKPGAGQALFSCRERGLALAVASSSPLRLIETVVDRLGLRSWFGVLHSAQDEPAGKPDPSVFLTTAVRLGVDPPRCVVFEDSPAGVRAAVAAGMVCVAVPEADVVVTDADARNFESADMVIDTLEDVDDDFWTRLVESHRDRVSATPPVPAAESG